MNTLTRVKEKSIQGKQQQMRKGQTKNHSCMLQGNAKKQQTSETAKPYRAKARLQAFCKKVISSTS